MLHKAFLCDILQLQYSESRIPTLQYYALQPVHHNTRYTAQVCKIDALSMLLQQDIFAHVPEKHNRPMWRIILTEISEPKLKYFSRSQAIAYTLFIVGISRKLYKSDVVTTNN